MPRYKPVSPYRRCTILCCIIHAATNVRSLRHVQKCIDYSVQHSILILLFSFVFHHRGVFLGNCWYRPVFHMCHGAQSIATIIVLSSAFTVLSVACCCRCHCRLIEVTYVTSGSARCDQTEILSQWNQQMQESIDQFVSPPPRAFVLSPNLNCKTARRIFLSKGQPSLLPSSYGHGTSPMEAMPHLTSVCKLFSTEPVVCNITVLLLYVR